MRKQQEMLLEAEKEKNNILTNSIKMKDQFLSLMSHEFKTPLNVILSAIQAMECLCQEELSSKATKY
jgi:signal transduction histidine kinase